MTRLLVTALLFLSLSLVVACADKNIEVRPKGQAVIGVGVGNGPK